MSRLSTIELFKEDMKFSAGHFAIFSETQRENCHGHHYTVYFACTTLIDEAEGIGMSFDYRFYKHKLTELCDELNEIFLMPGNCPFLKFEDTGDYWHVHFNGEKIIFLKRDLKILPLRNITIEELSNYLLQRVLEDKEELQKNRVQRLEVKVFSAPGQGASATWSINDK